MILELDVGNTRAKWRTLDEAGQRCQSGKLALSDEEAMALLAEQLDKVSSIRVASVASDAANQQLQVWAENAFGVTPAFARTTAVCAGVVNSYREPERMGVDRWLAMLAAYREVQGNLLVVDAGSALTLDMVSADGQHVGGYIVPGLSLMEAVLQGDTGRVRYQERDDGDWSQPGRSTAEAVQRGVRLALRGAVEQSVSVAQAHFAGLFTVLLAGGDAELLADLPSLRAVPVLERPELVMDGLALALD